MKLSKNNWLFRFYWYLARQFKSDSVVPEEVTWWDFSIGTFFRAFVFLFSVGICSAFVCWAFWVIYIITLLTLEPWTPDYLRCFDAGLGYWWSIFGLFTLILIGVSVFVVIRFYTGAKDAGDDIFCRDVRDILPRIQIINREEEK